MFACKLVGLGIVILVVLTAFGAGWASAGKPDTVDRAKVIPPGLGETTKYLIHVAMVAVEKSGVLELYINYF